MKEIERRRQFTLNRSADLVAHLAESKKLIARSACVYATGSFGRLEASEYSDLDLFIVGRSVVDDDGTVTSQSQLSLLDEICVKADLIEAIRDLKIPDFDGDGKYLIHRSVNEFVTALGTPEDDAHNTFTARLLMLLESKPLLGPKVYSDAVDSIIAAYWRDFKDHKSSFVPAYLANDILRLWRTFCVNYEARTQRDPEEKKTKGKLKNYKLRHSRILTCFSTLLVLLATFEKRRTVTPKHVIQMTRLTPIERLQSLLKEPSVSHSHRILQSLIDQYNIFLEKTNEPEGVMVLKFADKERSKELSGDAARFGNLMFDAVTAIGNSSTLHRMLVV